MKHFPALVNSRSRLAALAFLVLGLARGASAQPLYTATDLGDFESIITSIDRRIFAAFDPTTLVFPGHGSATTVGNESPHLQEWADRGW